jgi:hypothetical protein
LFKIAGEVGGCVQVLKDAPDGHIIEDVDEHPFVIHIADAERLETGLEWKASIEPLKRWHDHERAALFVHDRLDGPVRARGDHHTMRMPGLHRRQLDRKPLGAGGIGEYLVRVPRYPVVGAVDLYHRRLDGLPVEPRPRDLFGLVVLILDVFVAEDDHVIAANHQHVAQLLAVTLAA